ncbi:MAG: class V aminotransferase [Beggiatoa sp. IS2]|nr:MAG: class V aminotransferase [Beggiatoa sp. IS2]
MDITQEFPIINQLIYLNHAAVSPWPRRTAEIIRQFALESLTYGGKHYVRWEQQEQILREQLRQLLNAPAVTDIALLKNTSEALSVVAYGLPWQPGDNVVITDHEFPSNRIVWESLRTKGVNTRTAKLQLGYTEVENSKIPDPEAEIIAQVDEKTRLISVSSVQYASGLRLDLARIGLFCRNNDILFCVDAIQSLGAIPCDVQANYIDFLMADSHKWLLGPEGLAVFYCRAEQREQLQLNQFGWHMVEQPLNFEEKNWKIANSARRFECGSPNMLGIHALSASLSLLLEVGINNIATQLLDNTHYLLTELPKLSDIEILSAQRDNSYAGIVTFRRRQGNTGELFKRLQQQGIICAQRWGGIRLSPHFYNSKLQLQQVIEFIDQTQI